jgi:hypothetical protein
MMARSRAIWVVMENDCLRAAFTVKHELVTWLRSQSFASLRFCAFRCPDGIWYRHQDRDWAREEPRPVSIRELIETGDE